MSLSKAELDKLYFQTKARVELVHGKGAITFELYSLGIERAMHGVDVDKQRRVEAEHEKKRQKIANEKEPGDEKMTTAIPTSSLSSLSLSE